MWLYGCVVLWLCGFVVLWLCGCVVVWLCGCVVVCARVHDCNDAIILWLRPPAVVGVQCVVLKFKE